jgi:tRNA(adenine34) deaminase
MNIEDFMRRAIALALEVPEFPFGAVIVKRATGEIVAEDFNQSALNPVFHGEMVAINRCAVLHQPADWSEFDLYTTAEPCPMCQSAIEWAGFACVCAGSQALAWERSAGSSSFQSIREAKASPRLRESRVKKRRASVS